MLNPLQDWIDPKQILELQNAQYQDVLVFDEQIPVGELVNGAVNVTSVGHFLLVSITGEFTTIENDLDDGVNRLTMQLLDGSNQRTLFSNFVSVNTILSPGRVLLPGVAGAASSQLEMEWPFIYLFPINSSILVRVQSGATLGTTANQLRLTFKGIRIFDRQTRI